MSNVKKIQLSFRQAERRDIPLLTQWILSPECQKNLLLEYPTTPTLLKNQLLKEMAVSELIFSSRLIYVAELNNKALVGAAFVRAIDWKNSHCILDLFFPKEVSPTEIPTIVRKNALNYLFQELHMHKVYQHCLSVHKTQKEFFTKQGKEPEVVLNDYYRNENTTADLFIYAEYPG